MDALVLEDLHPKHIIYIYITHVCRYRPIEIPWYPYMPLYNVCIPTSNGHFLVTCHMYN